jgi:hypothetical protein
MLNGPRGRQPWLTLPQTLLTSADENIKRDFACASTDTRSSVVYPCLGVTKIGISVDPAAVVGLLCGEVGLIFAGIGLTLRVDGRRILDEAIFSAILIMVMVTTLVTPPLLQ